VLSPCNANGSLQLWLVPLPLLSEFGFPEKGDSEERLFQLVLVILQRIVDYVTPVADKLWQHRDFLGRAAECTASAAVAAYLDLLFAIGSTM
jgi:hypothetical protein